MTTKTYYQSKTLEDRVNGSEQSLAAIAAGTGKPVVKYTDAITISKSDCGCVVVITKGTGVACTFAADADETEAIPVGSEVDIIQGGAGLVTYTAGSGATVNKAAATLKSLGANARVTARKMAADTWQVNGELAAS